MNGSRPSIGIEFDDEYINAKNKLIEFIKACDRLKPMQREQLALDFMKSYEGAKAFEQFVRYINNRR